MFLLRLWAIACFLAAPLAFAQCGPAAATSAVKLDTEIIKTGLYLITGGGSNSVLRLTGNGMILANGKSSGNYAALMAQVRRIEKEQPIAILIPTDHREQYNGDAQKFLDAGTQIVAQKNLAKNRPSSCAPPSLTFDSEYTIKLGGVTVQLLHFDNAFTNGDTVVYYPDLKVVAVGDLFTAEQPNPDLAAGGTLTGWSQALTGILKLDFDTVVPGNGPRVTRKDLQALKVKIDGLASK